MKLLVRAIDYYRKIILAGYMILKKPYNDVLYGGARYTLLLAERIFHL
jgi:histidyl-tRNA synthetase